MKDGMMHKKYVSQIGEKIRGRKYDFSLIQSHVDLNLGSAVHKLVTLTNDL